MTSLIFRSLKYYWRNHVAVLIGVFLASAVLTGALSVGDSVKATLSQLSDERMGNITHALIGNDRFFSQALVDKVGTTSGMRAVPLIQIQGTVKNEEGSARANAVNIIGIRDDFWTLGDGAGSLGIDEDKAVINEELAARLGVGVGDTILARVELPGALSKDAPLSGETDETVALRVEIQRVVSAEDFGNYSLKAEQTPALNLFVPLTQLEVSLDKRGRSNIALFAGDEKNALQGIVNDEWTADDADLVLVDYENTWDVVSRRVLIDDQAESVARSLAPEARGVFTYLVNSLDSGDRSTPYSMVAAVERQPSDDWLPEDLQADETVISQWLADDLQIDVGASVNLTYYTFAPGRELEERTSAFTVRSIVPMDHPVMNPRWTPDFPGVSDADNCRDWEPGIPIDVEKIRDTDEEYWEAYKGTPKAFIALEAGQAAWNNRFGNLTSLRLPPGTDGEAYRQAFDQRLVPDDFGVQVINVKENADLAVANSLDFGMYLSIFSYFMIVAALILTVLLFVFGIDQRQEQIGVLRSLGFRPWNVRLLYILEGGAVALIGSLMGVLGGIVYTKSMLWALSHIWQSATGSLDFVYSLTMQSAFSGAYIVFFIALVAMFFATRRITRVRPIELLKGQTNQDSVSGKGRKLTRMTSFWLLPICLLFALVCIIWGMGQSAAEMGQAFAGAGFFLLVSGLLALSLLLRYAGRLLYGKRNLLALGIRNSARRRGRSLAVIVIMAAGVFIICVTNAFQIDATANADDRSSGTGGFPLIAESSLPIYENLNSPSAREAYALDDEENGEFSFVSFRVREGEEASCLNLNQAQRPRLVAVDPEGLIERNAFSFQQSIYEGDGSPWALLDEPLEDGVIPGVMDYNSAMYALKSGLGGEIDYEDGSGNPIKVRLVGLLRNTVLQGNVVISESNFIKNFPAAGGYRLFLVDGEEEHLDELQANLTHALDLRGTEFRSTIERLAEFNAVQNTYLQMMSTLGGLGLLLGTVGLAVVVARNILERRRELALMEAVGFTRRRLSFLVLSEHWFLHLSAVILGLVTAMLAILPAVQNSGQPIPLGMMTLLLVAILIGGMLFCWCAARVILNRPLLDALRNE